MATVKGPDGCVTIHDKVRWDRACVPADPGGAQRGGSGITKGHPRVPFFMEQGDARHSSGLRPENPFRILHGVELPLLDRVEGFAAGVLGGTFQLFLDADELVVLGDAVGAAQ